MHKTIPVVALAYATLSLASSACNSRSSTDEQVRAAQKTPTSPEGGGTPSLSGFALLRPDARLFRHLGDASPIRAYKTSPDTTKDDAAATRGAYVVKIVEQQAEWVRFVNPTKWTRDKIRAIHCVDNEIIHRDLAIELWTRIDNLLPVITRTVEHSYSDGTSVTLLPGTPIYGGIAWAYGFPVPLQLPTDAIANHYRPLATLPQIPGEKVLGTTIDRGVTYALNGQELPRNQQDVPRDILQLTRRRPVISITRGELNATNTQVALSGACGQLNLTVTSGKIQGGLSHLGVMPVQHPYLTLPAGSALQWPDGRAAGSVTRPIKLHTPIEDLPKTAQSCLGIPVGRQIDIGDYNDSNHTNSYLKVCLPTQTIVQEPHFEDPHDQRYPLVRLWTPRQHEPKPITP